MTGWNFADVDVIEYVRVMNRRYSRIAMSWPGDEGTSLRECPGIVKRCTQGLARTRIALCQRPGADTEETGRYDLAWKRFV